MEQKKKKRKWLVWVLILAAVVLVGGFLGLGNDSDEATPADQTASNATEVKPDFTMLPSQLDKEYSDNAAAADGKYKGKIIELAGKVEGVDKDVNDKLFVALGDDGFLSSVQVYFPNSAADKVTALKKGDAVTVRAKCDGKGLVSVILIDGVLVPAK